MGQQHRADGGRDQQAAGELHAQPVLLEQRDRQVGDRLVGVGVNLDGLVRSGHGLEDRRRDDDDQAETTEHRRDDRAAALAGVVVGGADTDQHDDEEEQHHDRAGVHDDLRDAQEGSAVRDVQDCQAEHDADHTDDRVRGLLEEEDTQSAGDHDNGRACEEDDLPR